MQIIQNYLQVLLNKEIYKIEQSSYENAEKLYQKSKLTTQAGLSPFSVESEALAELSRKNKAKLNAENEVKRALFNLSVLLTLEEDEDFDIEEDFTSEIRLEEPPKTDFGIQEIIDNQPIIHSAKNQIQSAKMQTEIVKTNLYPTLSGYVGLGSYYFNNFNDAFTKSTAFIKQYTENFGQQISISAMIPIFNKGITRLQIEQSKMQENLAENNLSQQKMQLKQNIQKAIFDVKAHYQNYISSFEVMKNANLSLGFAEKSYLAGKITIYELNTTRNNAIAAESEMQQAKYNYIFNQKILDFYARKEIQ